MSLKIKCVPSHGQDEIEAIDAGLRFRSGEVKEVTDVQAAILLGSRDFVVSDSGVNPNFTCQICKATTYGDAFIFRGQIVSLVSSDGKRVCNECFEQRAMDAPIGDLAAPIPASDPIHVPFEQEVN